MKTKIEKIAVILFIIAIVISCTRDKSNGVNVDPNKAGGNELMDILARYQMGTGLLRSSNDTDEKTEEIVPLGNYVTEPLTEDMIQKIPYPMPMENMKEGEIGNTGRKYYYDADITSEVGKDQYTNQKGIKLYRDMRKKVKGAYSEQAIYVDNMNGIFPGAVLKGDEIANGGFASVNAIELAPVMISGNFFTSEGIDPENLQSVEIIPQYSNYMNLYRTWLSNSVREGYVATTCDIQEVNLNTKGGLTADGSFTVKEAINIGFQINNTFSSMKSHVMVRFVQKIFNISMDKPSQPFINSLDLRQLGGVKPVYVSDINYGRIVYAIFSSSANSADLMASVKALFNDPTGKEQGGSITGNLTTTAEKANVQFRIIGGTQAQHGKVLKDGTGADLKEFIANPIELRNAAPISFTLRFVDDNARAKVIYSGDMPYQEAIFIPFSTKRIQFGAQITDIKVQNKAWQHANIHGTVKMVLPGHKKAVEMPLFTNGKNNYLRVPNGNQWIDVRNNTSKVAGTLDMTTLGENEWSDYLGWCMSIEIELYSAGDAGMTNGNLLAKTIIRKPLRDFLFDCEQGYMEVGGQGLGILDTNATLRITLDKVIMN